jgi:hypothetical protein
MHASVLGVPLAGNPTSVVRGHYIGLRCALCWGSVGPLFWEGTHSNWGLGLTLSVRKLDTLPSKQVSVNRPGPGSQEGQGSTESS